mmetsp:Transcript_20287/g.46024  ORF Transcript_20287/g.46024 Transcript_20287/m.46024 type:complete len:244 (-) Transcript_20287:968-1699(-)
MKFERSTVMPTVLPRINAPLNWASFPARTASPPEASCSLPLGRCSATGPLTTALPRRNEAATGKATSSSRPSASDTGTLCFRTPPTWRRPFRRERPKQRPDWPGPWRTGDAPSTSSPPTPPPTPRPAAPSWTCTVPSPRKRRRRDARRTSSPPAPSWPNVRCDASKAAASPSPMRRRPYWSPSSMRSRAAGSTDLRPVVSTTPATRIVFTTRRYFLMPTMAVTRLPPLCRSAFPPRACRRGRN